MAIMKKLLMYTTTAVAAVALTLVSASACTGIYVGSALTEDGGTYFARSEDISNSYNKVFYVSPEGNHQAGETYEGCYGWSYTFTKDSYSYTAFRDDNLSGECPDCGQKHAHTPYEAAGTNSQGVTVTATVTVGANDAVSEVDPLDDGIEEAEITTILLSESSTAREAVDLLLSIYDESGTQGGNGIFIADQTETWYVENTTGHQYIALRLSDDLIFVTPNMSILGEIDLDDENVIASKDLIAVAQQAGTFVGNAEENIIDFRASYGSTSIGARMWNGLNYLNSAYSYTKDTIQDSDFTVSNVKDGKIVPAYSAITADRTISISDMVDFYKVDGIGNTSNLDYHIFTIQAEGDAETATVEWVGMDHGKYGVMVPYYPMLTTDTYEGYQVSTKAATFVTEEPDGSLPYYATTTRKGSGYRVLPEGWDDSYYWSFDALSNTIIAGLSAGTVTEEQEAVVLDALAQMQQIIYDEFDALGESLDGSEYDAIYSTSCSEYLAMWSHITALTLYDYVTTGDVSNVDAFLFYLQDGATYQTVLAGETLADFPLPEGYSYKSATTAAPSATEEVVGPNGGTFEITFTLVPDVTTDKWYSEYIRSSVDYGIFQGYTDGSIKPNKTITRAEVVKVLWNLAGQPEAETAANFTDVKEGIWYSEAVAWAVENGITTGKTATTFAPNASITRQEFVTMVYRFAESFGLVDESTTGSLSAFTDSSEVSSYAQDALGWAVENGLVNGYKDKTIRPTGTITRAEVAKILVIFLLGE